jgi:hypothetical protein
LTGIFLKGDPGSYPFLYSEIYQVFDNYWVNEILKILLNKANCVAYKAEIKILTPKG